MVSAYNTPNTRPNFILVSMAALFGILILIIGYYIFALHNPKFRDSVLDGKKDSKTNDTNADNSNNGVAINNAGTGLETTSDGHIPGVSTQIFQSKEGNPDPQVFNIKENIYNYDDAQAACKVFGSELATIDQLLDAYGKGADWCNYGWLKGGLAYYPTQQGTYDKMQGNDPSRKNDCGLVGLNGGDFSDNPNILFGVNCFGVKPGPREFEKIKYNDMSDSERRIATKVAQMKKNMNDMTILPFDDDKWSS